MNIVLLYLKRFVLFPQPKMICYIAAVAFGVIHAYGQEQTIVGKVTDTAGTALAGVSIMLKDNARIGSSTDADGLYVLQIPSLTGELVFSFVGFEPQEISIGNRKEINVTLQPSSDELDEAVVVAFGTQKRREMVGSVTSINPTELKVPSSNLTTALAGRISGLIAYQRSGEPGQDNADFFIRGVTSFGYTAAPLILIDGLEMRSEDLARIQPDDIASFSIMKDASATSLYGARGANGVILVTTKEGKEGKAQVSIRYERSLSAPTQSLELADPVAYMKLNNEAVLTRDPLGVLPYPQEKIEGTAAGDNPLLYPAVDWHDMLFKKSTMNERVNFNVSGGGKVARYYVAATYNQDNGVLKVDRRNNFNSNIDLKKYLLRSNVNINLTNTTEVIARLHATFDDYTGPLDGATDLFNKVIHANPVRFLPYYEPDRSNELTQHPLFGNYDVGGYLNPYADLMKGYKDYTNSLMMAQFEVKQNFDFLLKGLKLRGLFSTTRYSAFDVQRFYNPFYYTLSGYDKRTGEYILFPLNEEEGTEHLDYLEGKKEVTSNTYIESAVSYDQVFNEVHTVNGLLVFNMRNRLVGNAGSLQNSLAFRNMGLAGRATYGFKNRYYIEGNFGYNGSERFSQAQRFGFFPSVGVSWLVSNEDFWNDRLKSAVSLFKLRFTHGLVGNDAIGSSSDRFFHLSQVNMNDPNKRFTFGTEFQNTQNGITVDRYENPDITWETAQKTNLGLELRVLNSMDINIDVYREKRANILMNRAYIPTTMGLQSIPRANVGKAKGQGVDASLDYQKNFANGLWLVGRVNVTYATSEYLAYEEPDYSATPWKSRIGYSLGQQWGYVAERLFVDEYEVRNSPYQSADAMAGDIKYKDINYDGVINELDQVAIGYPTTPEVIYGFGFSAGFKGFDLSCFFQGLGRESFWIDHQKTAPFVNETALLKVYEQSYWSESNRDLYALWPRLSNKLNVNNNAVSTWFMQDGSFLRLKSLELGYSLPEELVKRASMSRIRAYASGLNLLTFSNFKLWDPEMAGEGLGYPVQMVVNLGLQVSF